MIYGYARVSTKGQATDGYGLDVQEEQLREAGAQKIFSEAYTGTKANRPQLQALLDCLVEGDKVIVPKMDRIARSAKDGLAIIDTILEKKCSISILNMGAFDDSPFGKLARTMLLGFAEFERDMIVQRTQEGKAIARQRPDYHEKPKLDRSRFAEFFGKNQNGEMSVRDCAAAMGISVPTWYNMRKEYLQGKI